MHDPLHPSQFFIKRVIGLPGETVDIKDGNVTVINNEHPDGVVINEHYLGEGTFTRGTVHVALEENQYFVLGDNRDASLDSRVFGPVDQDLIVGRTWVRAWPFDRLGTLEAPIYNL
jgi:signal peptidase I